MSQYISALCSVSVSHAADEGPLTAGSLPSSMYHHFCLTCYYIFLFFTFFKTGPCVLLILSPWMCFWWYLILFSQKSRQFESHRWSELGSDEAQGDAGSPHGEDGDEGRLTLTASQLSQWTDRRITWNMNWFFLFLFIYFFDWGRTKFQVSVDLTWILSQAGWSERKGLDRQQMPLQKTSGIFRE